MAMRILATVALLGLGGIAVVAWLLVRPWHQGDHRPSPTVVPRSSATGDEREIALEQPEVPSDEVVAALSPEDVITDPDCRMALGEGPARNAAVVVVPAADGAWYAVVGQDGVMFDGKLPFQPDRHAVGERADGGVVAGFGREGNVQIFRDGQLAYELDNAWDFDVASDGSSFYVIEPLTGAARLVVRNLDLGEEHHYELDDSLVPFGPRRNFGTSYSTDFGEVIVSSIRGGWLSPYTSSGVGVAATAVEFNLAPTASTGVQRFFGVDGGPMRTVTAETTKRGAFFPPQSVLFASSETGYDVSFEDGAGWRIVKVNREYEPGGRVSRTTEVWSRKVALPDASPWLPPVLSKDGAWLGVWGSQFEILNAATGVPGARLSEDEEGDGNGIGFEFRGDRLFAYRRDGDFVTVHAVDLDDEDDHDGRSRVVGRLRNDPVVPERAGGILNDYSFEFDWDRTPGPSLRLAVCSEGIPQFGALRLRDGQLAFEPGSGTELP